MLQQFPCRGKGYHPTDTLKFGISVCHIYMGKFPATAQKIMTVTSISLGRKTNAVEECFPLP